MAKLLNYGDIVLPRRRKTIVLSIAIGVLLLIVLAALLLPLARHERVARQFVKELYATTEQDAADPSAKLNALRELATDELIDRLTQSGGIPALVIAENSADYTTELNFNPLDQKEQAALPNNAFAYNIEVRIVSKAEDFNRSGGRGVATVQLEKQNGVWKVCDLSAPNWQELLDKPLGENAK